MTKYLAILVPACLILACDVVSPPSSVEVPQTQNDNRKTSPEDRKTSPEDRKTSPEDRKTSPEDRKTSKNVLVRSVFQEDKGQTTVFLHGYGSNEEDMGGLARRAALKGTLVGYRAPIVMTTGRYAWFPVSFSNEGSKYDDTKVALAAEQVIKELEHEHTPVQLMGFSQGGMLSLYVGLLRPDLVSRVVVLSGAGPLPPTSDAKPFPKVFMAHGSADQVILIDRAHAVRDELIKRGITPTYVEIEGLPHAVDDEILQRLREWEEL